jgi:hypothetical protein
VAIAAMMAGPAGAAASAPRLYILNLGTPVTTDKLGIQVFIEAAGHCSLQSGGYGQLVTNGKTKDLMNFSGEAHVCNEEEPGYSISGTVTAAQFAATGAVQLKASPKIALNQPTTGGSCIYEFAKLSGTWFDEGPFAEGTAEGKLKKAGSLATCAKTFSAPFLVDVYDASSAEINLHFEVR